MIQLKRICDGVVLQIDAQVIFDLGLKWRGRTILASVRDLLDYAQAGVSAWQEVEFRGWLLGLVSFGVVATALEIAFVDPIIRNVLEFAALAAGGWYFHRWYEARAFALAE